MATSYYDIGTVTLTNGSKSVVGNGTGWQMALITGGNIFVQAPGNPLPIDTVDADNAITAELEWTGASGTYEYRLQRDSAYGKALDENSRKLSYLISEFRNGTLFKYDLAGPLANLAIHDGKPKGFSYLVLEGEAAQLYVKASNAEGDWAGPFAYGTGPVGPQGPVGVLDFKGDYNPATAYVANDGVRYNGSSWVALQSTTGNPPPNLPTTENVYWSLLAVKGQDGAGVGDMVASIYDPQAKAADAFDSANHSYDNAVSELAADTVQAAIDELATEKADIDHVLMMGELRNLIINPLGLVNQRQKSGTVALAAGAYGHDRFKAGTSGCTYTFSTNNGVTTFTITAGSLQQVIESSSFAGRAGDYLLSWQGSAQGKINGGTYGVSGAVSASCDGSANVTVEWGPGTLFLPQFELGSVSDFAGRHVAQEMSMCQRYYETGRVLLYIAVAGATQHVSTQRFAVRKRAAPTISGLSAGHGVQNVGQSEFDIDNITSYLQSSWVADAEL